jgi:hypothetical protein
VTSETVMYVTEGITLKYHLKQYKVGNIESDFSRFYDCLSRTMPFHVWLDPDRLYIHVKDYFSLRELVTENISRSDSMFFLHTNSFRSRHEDIYNILCVVYVILQQSIQQAAHRFSPQSNSRMISDSISVGVYHIAL